MIKVYEDNKKIHKYWGMIKVSEDNKKSLKYLGILFVVAIITHRLPHDSYSIIQYIIRPIKINNGAIYLSGIIPLILVIISIRGIFQIKKYENRSRIGIILLVFILVIPFMNWILDIAISNYYWIKNDGLNTIDIEEADYNISATDNIVKLDIDLDLIDYGRSQNEFTLRVYLPKTLEKYLGKEYYEFEQYYKTVGNRNKLEIKKQIVIIIDNEDLREKIFDSNYYREDVKYELYNNDETVQIIKHGL